MVLGTVAGLALLGFGIFQSGVSSANLELSSDEIREIVETQYPGEIIELGLEKDTANAYYAVKVESEGKTYDLRLDGNSGEIVSLEEAEKLTSNAEKADDKVDKQKDEKNDNSKKNNGESKKEDSDNAKDNQENTNSNDKKESSNSAIINSDKAREIALSQFSGTIENIERDEDDGQLIYEIEIVNGEDEAEIKINAYTGEVLVVDIDSEDDD